MIEVYPGEDAGFSSERLARIGTAMRRYTDSGKIAGVVSLVARHGKVVYFDCAGQANIADNVPMREDTLFAIYSMTKPITSVAILMLLEEGKLRLHDPLAEFVSAFANVKVMEGGPSGTRYVPATRGITIHDLLTHTSGLSYGFDSGDALDMLYQKQVWAVQQTHPNTTLVEMGERLAALPLAFQPGTHYRYSMATDVLGLVVQVVSGMPFETYLQEKIFAPLGMKDTGFWAGPDQIDRLAVTYGSGDSGVLSAREDPRTSRYAKPPACPSGGGGLVSSTEDYLRFAEMLRGGGVRDGVCLLGRKTVEAMASNHLGMGIHPWDNPAEGFGLGVGVLLDPGLAKRLGSTGTYGWSGAACTDFWVDPKEDLIGLLMLQYMPDSPIKGDFRTLVYQALVD